MQEDVRVTSMQPVPNPGGGVLGVKCLRATIEIRSAAVRASNKFVDLLVLVLLLSHLAFRNDSPPLFTPLARGRH